MKDKGLLYNSILYVSLFLTSCSMTTEEKKEKSNIISSDLKMIVDSILTSRNLKPQNIKHWSVNYHMLKRSSDLVSSYELPFEFDLCNSKNPSEYYVFDGVVFADSESFKVKQNKDGKYIVRMNILFHGDSGKAYTVDGIGFPEFEDVTSIVSEYDTTLNVPMSDYYRKLNADKAAFIRGMSYDDQAVALMRFREKYNNDCSFSFNGNWLEIKMNSYKYPISAGNPSTACKLFFEDNSTLLKYCTGVRIFNDQDVKQGAYRNPKDRYNP